MGLLVNATPRSKPLRERYPLPIVPEAGWAPGLVWTRAENLLPPGFDPRTVHSVANNCTDYTKIYIQLSPYAFQMTIPSVGIK
jgi:hypothetical protein